jgi:dephospho-CoA kinase
MLKVGLTGGIGSGKTTILRIFDSLGVPIYQADERAKWLVNHNSDIINSLCSVFGDDVYLNNKINTSYLSNLVFKDKGKLKHLNSIVHPVVAEDFQSWCLQQNAKYIVKEAAILIESDAYHQLDKVILVIAEIDKRIKRVILRDQVTKDEVLKRIKNQMSDDDKLPFADFIIKNDSKDSLIQKVLNIHKEIISIAGN